MKKKINLHIGLYFPHIILFFEGGSDETPASLESSAARKGTLRRTSTEDRLRFTRFDNCAPRTESRWLTNST